MCGQVVLALAHALGNDDDVLAGFAETIERLAELAQRREARSDTIRQQHDALDACITRRCIDCAQQIAQLHFPLAIAAHV